jgi:hypothetical protein
MPFGAHTLRPLGGSPDRSSVNQNALTGTIPSSVWQLTNLRTLYVKRHDRIAHWSMKLKHNVRSVSPSQTDGLQSIRRNHSFSNWKIDVASLHVRFNDRDSFTLT